MTIREAIIAFSKKEISQPYKTVWRGIFLRLSLYLHGKKPNYTIKKDEVYTQDSHRNEEELEPYTKIYKDEVLSRYPYDSENMINFRLSVVAVDDMQSLTSKFIEQSRSIIFQGNNFFITTEDQDLKKWIEDFKMDGFGFYEWVRNVLYQKIFEDPNAFLCVVEGHAEQFGANEKAFPVPVIITSDQVWFTTSEVFMGGRYAIDKTTQTQIKIKPHIDDVIIEETKQTYQHSLGSIPAVQLGGKFVSDKIWHSFIQPFVGIANTYLQEKSDIVVSKKVLAPRLQVISADCAFCLGTGKCDTTAGRVMCSTCKGKGRISLNLGAVVDVPENKAVMDEKLANLDRFKYSTPDTSYIEMLSKHADQEFMRAEKSLFIFRKETAASESSNNLDKQFEEKKIFFQSISERMFFLVDTLIKYVSMYLNYNNGNPKASEYRVAKPIDFDLASASELLLQYTEEQKAELPAPILKRTEKDYIKKIYGDDGLMYKKIDFLQLYDPLYGKSQDIIDLSSGISPLDKAVHLYLDHELELYIRDVTAEVFLRDAMQKTYETLLEKIKLRVEKSTMI